MDNNKVKIPKNLKSKVLVGIGRYERLRARVYLAFLGTTLSLSLFGVMMSLQYLSESFYQSGFYEYINLAFSGDNAVWVYWRELLLSILDSLPVVGVIAFLATLGILIWSGANVFSNTRRYILQEN